MIIKERRKHTRISLEGSKVFLPEGRKGQLVNASISGLAFQQPEGVSFEPGEKLDISVFYRGENIKGQAVVVHVTEGLVGCEWIDFEDQKQREAYYRWLLTGVPFSD